MGSRDRRPAPWTFALGPGGAGLSPLPLDGGPMAKICSLLASVVGIRCRGHPWASVVVGIGTGRLAVECRGRRAPLPSSEADIRSRISLGRPRTWARPSRTQAVPATPYRSRAPTRTEGTGPIRRTGLTRPNGPRAG
jgi:hypothetical protein